MGVSGLVLATILGIAMSRGVGAPELGEVEAGFEQGSTFALVTLDGEPLELETYADRPVFLYFWASWCAPCRSEAPAIQALWPEYEAAGYAFIGVNMLDSEQGARDFATEFAITFPLVVDVAGDVYLEYGVYGLPEAFFLRPGLQVEEKYIGELTAEVLREQLARIGPLEAGSR